MFFKFNDFHTEQDHDFLEYSDRYQISTFSGSNVNGSFVSRSDLITFKFTSDDNKELKGFNISYETVELGFLINYFYFNVKLKYFILGVTDSLFITTPHTFIKAEVNGLVYEIFTNNKEKFDLLNQNHQIINYYNIFHFYDWVHNLTIKVDTNNEMISLHNNNDIFAEESVKFFNIWNLSTNDLVINVKKCVIVWSVLGMDSSILESNYDGSEQTVLLGSRQTQHLTVDYHSDRYYFVDITDYSLYSIDFNGSNELFLMKSYSLFYAINSMTFVSNRLYISNPYLVYKIPDISSKIAIAEVLFETHGHKQELNSEFFTVNATVIQREGFISIFVTEVMPDIENKCLHSDCSHICIPIGQSHRCACPDLLTLVNETNCQPNDNFNGQQVMTTKKEDEPSTSLKLREDEKHDNNQNKQTSFNIILIILFVSTICMMIIFMFM